jgi:glycerol-3-phosphate acyltransferase PlsY
MQIFLHAVIILLAYLLGSIPSSVWIGKFFYDVDVREYGSGNAGFTNTVRVLGIKAGLPVFIIDVLKGWAAVNLLRLFDLYVPGTTAFVNMQLILGAFAVLGHIFPVLAGFRGGKGVATLLGLVLAIAPLPTLVCMGIFLVTLLLTQYVSLSSIVAGLAFPVLLIFVFKTSVSSLIMFSIIVSVLLLLTHQKNIERLLRREENKARIIRRRKNDRNR